MLGVAEHPFPNEVRETAGLFVCKGLGIAHQHQPVGMERPPERGVDIRVGIGDETQPLVEMLAADRDFILRRVDLLKLMETGKPVSEINEAELRDAADFANAAGSVCATKKGAIPALADRELIETCRASIPLLKL